MYFSQSHGLLRHNAQIRFPTPWTHHVQRFIQLLQVHLKLFTTHDWITESMTATLMSLRSKLAARYPYGIGWLCKQSRRTLTVHMYENWMTQRQHLSPSLCGLQVLKGDIALLKPMALVPWSDAACVVCLWMAIALTHCPMLPSHRRLFCVAPVKLWVKMSQGKWWCATLQDQLTNPHLNGQMGSPTDRAHVAETVKERVDVGTSGWWHLIYRSKVGHWVPAASTILKDCQILEE